MFFYQIMCRLSLPRSYLGKILAISFVGVHVPLIATVIFVLAASDLPLNQIMPVLLAILCATLIGTALT